MEVQVLHIEDCPSHERAVLLVRRALDELGMTGSAVREVLVTGDADEAPTAFAGSPTFVIGGADLFPTGSTSDHLACRVYATPDGLAGTPSLEQLRTAIRDRANP